MSPWHLSGFDQPFVLRLGIIKNHRPQKDYAGIQYGVLGATLIPLALGSLSMVHLLDPTAIFGKMVVHLAKPTVLLLNNIVADILESMDIFIVSIKITHKISHGVLIAAMVFPAFIVPLALLRGRIYCNSICPVGLLLAKISRHAVWRLNIDARQCRMCRKCADACKAGCIDIEEKTIDPQKCVACFNCLNACNHGAVAYSLRRRCGSAPLWSKRKMVLNTMAAGGLLLSACTPLRMGRWGLLRDKNPVMPPGGISRDHFTRTCNACHLCVSACPTRVIIPTLTGYGLWGIMLPHLSYEKAHCDFECNLCGRICPTGAIAQISIVLKKETKIGRVSLKESLCVIHVQKKHCGACGEACPTFAILPVTKGGIIVPQIRQDRCIGCGACEHACPTQPKAIVVTALQEHERAQRYIPEKRDRPKPSKSTEPFPF